MVGRRVLINWPSWPQSSCWDRVRVKTCLIRLFWRSDLQEIFGFLAQRPRPTVNPAKCGSALEKKQFWKWSATMGSTQHKTGLQTTRIRVLGLFSLLAADALGARLWRHSYVTPESQTGTASSLNPCHVCSFVSEIRVSLEPTNKKTHVSRLLGVLRKNVVSSSLWNLATFQWTVEVVVLQYVTQTSVTVEVRVLVQVVLHWQK